MSIRVMTWLWENSPASGTDLLVMLAIADNADDSGGNAWPSMRTLARKCRISERSVQRAIRSLQAAGLLMIEESAGRSGTHRFTVDMTKGRQLVTPDNLVTPTG
jgi:predicted transcriptional regulator